MTVVAATPHLLLAGCDSGELVCFSLGGGSASGGGGDVGDGNGGGDAVAFDGSGGSDDAAFPFASQLEELLLMGIDDADRARVMLTRHNGDVQESLNAIFDTASPSIDNEVAAPAPAPAPSVKVPPLPQQHKEDTERPHNEPPPFQHVQLWAHRPAADDASAVTAAVADTRADGHSVWLVGLANGNIKAIGTHSGACRRSTARMRLSTTIPCSP